MILINNIQQWREIRKTFQDKTLGFIPTMGNLHRGHMSLVERSKIENEIIVLSCFVNPTQFNDVNDFKKYPRTLKEDQLLCEIAGVDYFFVPDEKNLYPDHYHYQVTETKLSRLMEGKHRVGHFEGMLTIVLKLLLLIKPTQAYFGEKDFQQLQLVKGMAEAFFLDTKIVSCPTVRNDLGLALSSRNQRLTEEQMKISHYFSTYLHSNQSCEEITAALKSKGFEVEYIEEYEGRRYGAVRLGDVRLIDNVEVI